MTPALRTAILDALMAKCEGGPLARSYYSSCLDMILPVAEPMIREAALQEAAAAARKCASTYSRHPTSPPSNVDILNRGRTSASYETADACAVAILALREPK